MRTPFVRYFNVFLPFYFIQMFNINKYSSCLTYYTSGLCALSHERHIIHSFSRPTGRHLPHRPTVGCPLFFFFFFSCSRMAAHGAEGTALCPSAWLQRCTSLLTQERGHKTNTKRHAVRSESKQCRDCNLFLGRK